MRDARPGSNKKALKRVDKLPSPFHDDDMSDTLTAGGTPRKIKAGSGRKKGGFSFVLVPLSKLNEIFADKSTPITVGRVWAQQVGLKDLVPNSAEKLHGELEGQTPATKVGAAVRDFD